MGRVMMRKRLLGRTGVLVSEFALGTMTFGQEADEKAAGEILDQYVEGGGNVIDTADVYPPSGPKGTSEEIIGRWLRQHPGRRDSLILATKCRGRMDDSGNSEGLSRREIEWELVPVCLEEGLGILPWGPLGQGWLSGKYARDAAPRGATRLGEDPKRGLEAYDRRNIDRTWRVVDAVHAVASELGMPAA